MLLKIDWEKGRSVFAPTLEDFPQAIRPFSQNRQNYVPDTTATIQKRRVFNHKPLLTLTSFHVLELSCPFDFCPCPVVEIRICKHRAMQSRHRDSQETSHFLSRFHASCHRQVSFFNTTSGKLGKISSEIRSLWIVFEAWYSSRPIYPGKPSFLTCVFERNLRVYLEIEFSVDLQKCLKLICG